MGGEDHRTGEYPYEDPATVFKRLEAWTKERFPSYTSTDYQWSGQILEPMDGLAFIGRGTHKQTYIATGDSGNGMTHGTIAGILLTDLILGKKNPWENLYDPHRKTLKAFKKFGAENLNTLTQYADWVTRSDVDKLEEIQPGEGAILRIGAMKLAIYKDDKGIPHELSAICPHLGGLVRWNAIEKTWDCPCHGSRFTKEGEVINGPALSNLKKPK
ncbi:MAG: FAD-dependent oxidoreductase [Parachlamydiales bacterium]